MMIASEREAAAQPRPVGNRPNPLYAFARSAARPASITVKYAHVLPATRAVAQIAR